MKKILLSTLALIFLLAAGKAFAGHFDSLERGPLVKIKPPNIREVVLKNGIRCFLLEDHTLPMVRVNVISKTGAIYDPPDKVGLAVLTGTLMRSAGAGKLGPADFDSAVDGLGASISSNIGAEMGQAEAVLLSADLESGMGLLFDMIFGPRFDPSRFNVSVLKIEEALRREDDDPDSLAAWRFKQLVYGANSPWARRPDKKTLGRITLQDVRDFHKNFFRTGNLIIAAAGDFDSEKLVALIERLTAGAPGGEAVFPLVPKVVLEFKPATEDVVRPLTQSFIRMGHLGIKRHNPDKFSLMLMNDILGASNFKSRLMEDIRTKRGMAYSIWSDLNMGTDYGTFTVGVDTKSSQAKNVIGLIKGQIEELADGGDVTDGELKFARQSVLSRLVFEFDSASKAVVKRATFYYYGYPDNYWQIFRDGIEKVTTKDVKAAAEKYLHPEGLKIVIVGPKT